MDEKTEESECGGQMTALYTGGEGGGGRQQQKHELQTRHFTARCGALTGGGLGGGDPSEGRDLSPQAFKVSAFSMKHEVRKPPT